MHKHYIITALLFLIPYTGVAQKRYTLQQALQTAKANNPDLKTEHFNIDIAASDEVSAGMRPNPVLGFNYLTAAGSHYYAPDTGMFSGLNTQTYLQFGKVFQLPGTRSDKLAFAEKVKLLASNSYEEKERNLFYDVASHWVSVWGAKKKYDVIKKAGRRLDTIVKLNNGRGKDDSIREIDNDRMTLLSTQYQLELKSSEQALKNEVLDLKFSLGVPDNIYIETEDNLNYPIPDNLKEFLDGAVNTRTDLLSIESSIAVATSAEKLQRALAYPQPELGMVYNPQNAVPYVGIYGNIPIPIFSRNQGEIKKAGYMKQQALENLEGAQEQIVKEITNAFNSYQTLKTNVQNYNKLIAQSEKILANIRDSYLKGGTGITDLLEVQRSSLETQLQYAEILEQYRESYVRLLFASGRINKLAQ